MIGPHLIEEGDRKDGEGVEDRMVVGEGDVVLDGGEVSEAEVLSFVNVPDNVETVSSASVTNEICETQNNVELIDIDRLNDVDDEAFNISVHTSEEELQPTVPLITPREPPPQLISEPLPSHSPDPQSPHHAPDQSSQFLSCIPQVRFSSNLSPLLPTGLHWSPCGDHLAVSSDTSIQVYSPWQDSMEDADLTPSASIRHAECLYSWVWTSGPSTTSPTMLVTTGRYQPVQLYTCQSNSNNRLDIQLESTYKCINQLDELSHAFSVALDRTSSTLYCGLKGEVRVFDVSRPGRVSTCHVTRGKKGQNGIVSCLAVSDVLPVYAAGCYDRTVGLYSEQGDRLCVLRGQLGGVTQLAFTKDGTKLFAGGRKDNEVLCWDLRQPGMVLYTLQREVTTNQTIQFTLSPCQKYLSSANTDGSVRIWDLDRQADSMTGVLEPMAGWLLHKDASNGVSWHPGGELLATCSGQRHFKMDNEMYMEEDEEVEENSVVVWKMS